MTAAEARVGILRQREANTAATLREIDGHISRLQQAKADREAALVRIRAMLALVDGPAAPEGCED